MKKITTMSSNTIKSHIVKWLVLCATLVTLTTSCEREPILHLHRGDIQLQIPMVDVNLDVMWDYNLIYDYYYDWRSEWYYGEDEELFGGIGDEFFGYHKPDRFELRRYFTGDFPNAPHSHKDEYYIEGYTFSDYFEWGFHDILAWNYISPNGMDEAISIHIDERTTLDSVFAYTNRTTRSVRLPSRSEAIPSHYQPEELFSAYEQAIEINRNLDGFVWDPERKLYVKTINSTLQPLTYIYLTQVILHGNAGRIVAVDGEADITGMAYSTNVNTGNTGLKPVGVNYACGFKQHVDYNGEDVDIVGGRVLTFGLCGLNGSTVSRGPITEDKDPHHHYIDCTFVFNNGSEKTVAFDVTDQVRRLFKGGVLTVHVNVDDIEVPDVGTGSSFNAIVEESVEEEHEIPM